MKKLIALLLCFMIIIPFSACGKRDAKNANKTISYHLDSEPKTLDPQIASGISSNILIEALYEGLVRLDSTNTPYPGVAESWQANADFTEFTFTLRENATWSDKAKTPVTAADFVYAFHRALAPETNSPICSSMFCIKNAKEIYEGNFAPSQLGVVAKGEHTLVISLEYSYENFPALTASTAFMPCNKAFFETTAGRYGMERRYILGNGPFVIDGAYGWEHGSHMNLKRSFSYAGDKPPLPSALVCIFGSKTLDLSDPVAALTQGKVNAAAISAEDMQKAQAAKCSLVAFQDTTWGLCFNVRQQQELNPLQNLNVRKAFLQSLNREKILSHIPKGMSAAEDIITPSTTLFGEAYRKKAGTSFYIKQDKNASALMNAGVQTCGLESVPKVTVLCPNSTAAKLAATEIISGWNSAFDDYFNMEPLSEKELSSRVSAGDYQIALCSIQPSSDGPLNLLSLFKSGAKNNPAGLRATAYDTLLETAEHETSTSAADSYAQAERYLNEQAIFYPLYYQSHYFACAPGVTGIVFHPYGAGADFIQAGKD